MPATDNRVDYHARRFFLTFPRCDITKEEMLEHMARKLERDFHYIIGRETHEDGTPHLHVYLEFGRPLRVRDARHFDVGAYHPNIQTVRRPAECQQYCTKDGDYIANMSIGTVKRTYGEIVKNARTREEFLVMLEESHARDLVLNLQNVNRFLDWRYPNHESHDMAIHSITDFMAPETLENWYLENVLNYEGDPLSKRWLIQS